MNKSKIGIFHEFIIQKLRGRCINNNSIKRRDLRIFLCTHTIPKNLHDKFIKELERYGLVKVIDKQKIEIIKLKQK